MPALLHRVGSAAAAHPWRTIAAWILLLATGTTLATAFGGKPHDDYDVPGIASQAPTHLLQRAFPEWAGTDARVVLHDRAGHRLDAALLERTRHRLAALPHVSSVSTPQLSADADTALYSVQYAVPVTEFDGSEGVDALKSAIAPAQRAGLRAELGGMVPENASAPSGTAEIVGIVVALLILVFAFGSVVAAGVPIAVALIGLGVGTAGIGFLALLTDVSTSAPTVASMVGIGAGIDYALLLITRHVEALRRGLEPRTAAAEATAAAGPSVLFAGSAVLGSLLGLRLADLPVYSSFGYATALVVLAVMATSVTLVPALCALAGHRLLGRRRARPRPTTTRTERWARKVSRRPLGWAVGSFVVLVALALPMLAMRTWPQDAGSQPGSNTTRRAHDLIAAEYGPGANGPLLVVLDLRNGDRSADDVRASLSRLPGVAEVTMPQVAADGGTAVLTVVPTTKPDDPATTELVKAVRHQVPAGSGVTGTTAAFADISQRLADRLWVVIAFVVAVGLVLLTAIFRSVVVAVKAAAMNLLSVAAAYGVMTMVFQWGWGARLLGLPHAVPVSSWVPILMFAVLFGVSMDYEVFLLSRVREDWLATQDPTGSVARGLGSTGPVITSAAAIMVAVFVGFALDPDVTVKMIGFGMAVGVLIDATLVRMVLVPATMALLGRRNWWLPAWLDRRLPRLDRAVQEPTEPARELVSA